MVCLNAFVAFITNELGTGFFATNAAEGTTSSSSSSSPAVAPGRSWVAEQVIRTLLQYPSGMSYCVLLTELDAKWRMLLRRGENAGKLRQVLAVDQVLQGDVLRGALVAVGADSSGRFLLVDSSTSVDLILHSQFDDLLGFLRHYGIRLCRIADARRQGGNGAVYADVPVDTSPLLVSCVGCRLVRTGLARASLLTTRLALFELVVPHAVDILEGPIVGTHKYFMGQYPSWVNEAPEDQGIMGVIAAVRAVSPVLEAVGQQLSGGAPEQQGQGQGKRKRRYRPRSCTSYCTVLLELLRLDDTLSSEGGATSKSPWLIYLVLVDDEVELAADLSANDLLYIYRPWLASNCEDPAVFGGNGASTAHSNGASALPSEVSIPRAAHLVDGAGGEAPVKRGPDQSQGDLLRHFGGPLRGACDGGPRAADGVGIHLSYGAVTAIVKLKEAANRLSPISTALMTLQQRDPASLNNGDDEMLSLWAGDLSVFGRVRCIVREPQRGSSGHHFGAPWSPGERPRRGAPAAHSPPNDAILVCEVPMNALDMSQSGPTSFLKSDIHTSIFAISCKECELPCASNGRGDSLLEGNIVLLSHIRVDKIKRLTFGNRKVLTFQACLSAASRWRHSPAALASLDRALAVSTVGREVGGGGALGSETDQTRQVNLDAVSGGLRVEGDTVFERFSLEINAPSTSANTPAVYNVSTVAALVNSPSLIRQHSNSIGGTLPVDTTPPPIRSLAHLPVGGGGGLVCNEVPASSELVLVRAVIEAVRVRAKAPLNKADTENCDFRDNIELQLSDGSGRAVWCGVSPSCLASAHMESLLGALPVIVIANAPPLSQAMPGNATAPHAAQLQLVGQRVTCSLSPRMGTGGSDDGIQPNHYIDVITEIKNNS